MLAVMRLSARQLVHTMLMVGSDLCSSTKPWDLQLLTLGDIYEEFYTQVGTGHGGLLVTVSRYYEFLTQGDIELAHGRLPVPIMNRVCSNDQALHQVPCSTAALQHCSTACLVSPMLSHRVTVTDSSQ